MKYQKSNGGTLIIVINDNGSEETFVIAALESNIDSLTKQKDDQNKKFQEGIDKLKSCQRFLNAKNKK
jgi:hypothetical protein